MQVQLKNSYGIRTALDDVVRDVTAFANSSGGRISISLNQQTALCINENASNIIQEVTDRLRRDVKPDVVPWVHFQVLTGDGNEWVALDVEPGPARPYYLTDRGLTGGGVYIREGNTSIPASATVVRCMLQEGGLSFEERRSLNQQLSFAAATEFFADAKISFEDKKRDFGIVSEDGEYTNLGWLLSDQYAGYVKTAFFGDFCVSRLKSCRCFSGSLLTQTNDLLDYLRNAIAGNDVGDRRSAYPESAVREAVINMMVHSDYASGASNTVSLFSDRMEITSGGGLYDGMVQEDISQGISVCRNPNLARVFQELRLMEAYGIGMRTIMGAYADGSEKPTVTVTKNVFRVTLPNLKSCKGLSMSTDITETTESAVRRWASDRDAFSRSELDDYLHCSVATSNRLLRRMLADCVLVQSGSGRNTRYRLNIGGTGRGELSASEKPFPENYSNVFEYLLDHGPSEPMTGFTELCESDANLDLPQEIFR